MSIHKVTVKFGVTINEGDYENMRMDVHIEADMSQSEVEDGDLNHLIETAQNELAYGLVDMAEAKLRATGYWDEDQAENQRRALRENPEFRWIHKLNPDMARDMLAGVTNEYWEAKGVVAVTPPPAPLPVNGEGETDDDEPDYTGDGFTEEHDDGFPADAHPDDVEYEKARTTYPDLPQTPDDEPDDVDAAHAKDWIDF